jgi:hypothetical protein
MDLQRGCCLGEGHDREVHLFLGVGLGWECLVGVLDVVEVGLVQVHLEEVLVFVEEVHLAWEVHDLSSCWGYPVEEALVSVEGDHLGHP